MFDRYHIVTPDRLKANAEKLEAAFREKDAALEQSNQGEKRPNYVALGKDMGKDFAHVNRTAPMEGLKIMEPAARIELATF